MYSVMCVMIIQVICMYAGVCVRMRVTPRALLTVVRRADSFAVPHERCQDSHVGSVVIVGGVKHVPYIIQCLPVQRVPTYTSK